MKNSIFVIKPYKWNGMWVFDDKRGPDSEPFVAGADTMTDGAAQLKGHPECRERFPHGVFGRLVPRRQDRP